MVVSHKIGAYCVKTNNPIPVQLSWMVQHLYCPAEKFEPVQ